MLLMGISRLESYGANIVSRNLKVDRKQEIVRCLRSSRMREAKTAINEPLRVQDD